MVRVWDLVSEPLSARFSLWRLGLSVVDLQLISFWWELGLPGWCIALARCLIVCGSCVLLYGSPVLQGEAQRLPQVKVPLW